MKALLRLALLAVIAALLHPVSAAPSLPEYSAAEAKKHIGEKATVVGKVECVDAGRTYHVLTLDGCMPNSPFWIVVQDDASGPDLNVNELKGVTVAVSGKIEKPQTQPWLVVKSTSQIVPRTKLNPDYLGRAREKEQQGDLDGAIAEFGRAIEFNHEATAYLERMEIEEKKGDLDAAIAECDQLIQHHPEAASAYYIDRAGLKTKKNDYDGAIADSDSALRLLPQRGETIARTNAHNARATAKEAKGDFAGAATDYQMLSRIVPNGRQLFQDKAQHALAQAERQRPKSAPKTAEVADAGSAQAPDKKDFEAAKAEYGSADALVARGKLKMRNGDFDGAIADCDRALQLSRGRSKEASGLRIQAMRAKGSSKSAVAQQRVNPGRSQEEQPIAPTTKSGPAVAAGEKMSDDQIKQKLLGYWSSPRHGYHISDDGVIYMCPRKYATTTDHWNVKDSKFYWDNLPHTIVTLTDNKFVYREIGGHGRTATLVRGTKEEVDPD